MSEIISGVGCSILAAIIYDIAKVFFGSKNDKKIDQSKNDIATMIQDKLGQKYALLLMSGNLNSFLQTSAFKDTIENYLVYKVTGRCSDNIIKLKKADDVINEQDVVDFLSCSLLKDFDDVCAYKPTKIELEQFFCDFFKISDEYLFSLLNTEDKLTIQFVNGKIDSAVGRLLLRIDETIDIINRTMKCDIMLHGDNYDENVRKYHSKLKINNSTAHIYLLDTFNFAEFYVPPVLINKTNGDLISDFLFESLRNNSLQLDGSDGEESGRTYDDWKHIFDKTNIVYVTGGAGYGKSLFLKKIINDFEQMNILNSTEYLVIYGDLKAFYVEGDNPISVIKFLQNSMVNESLMDQSDFPFDMINSYIKRGRCLVLLDALDEVEKSRREDLYKKITGFFKVENPNNRICITSRNRGFIPRKDVEVYDISKLDGEQIELYVNNIIKLGKFDEKDKEQFLKQARILVDKGFLNSFLVLSLLINIYKAERELPENKMELYQKCFDYIAYKREKEKTKARFDWDLISCMMKDNTFMELSRMCFPNNSDIGKDDIIKMLCNVYYKKYVSMAETERAADNFIAFCSDRTELFVPAAGEDRFRFFHRSFFEYFYAQYIFVRIRDIEKVYESLQKFDVDSEVFELTLAMMKQKDEFRYQELIDYIFAKATEEVEMGNFVLGGFNTLTLGMQVVDDDVYMHKYAELLIHYSEKISLSINTIPNQKIIYSVISCHNELAQLVTEAYEEVVRYKVIKLFLNFYFEHENSISERQEISLKQIYSWRRRNIYYPGRNFYERLYFRNKSISNIFEETQDDGFYNMMTNLGVSKRQRKKYIRLFKKYKKVRESSIVLEIENKFMNELIAFEKQDDVLQSSIRFHQSIVYYRDTV